MKTIAKEQVIFFGFNEADYRRMFALEELHPKGIILNCAAGVSDFVANLHQQGIRAVACDPLYAESPSILAQHVQSLVVQLRNYLPQVQDTLVIGDVADFVQTRLHTAQTFLADFAVGQGDRYQAHALPDLPWREEAFGLALCSHFLFTYSEQLSLAFHQEAIASLCRVAQEVRIFPLVEYQGVPSRHLGPVLAFLQASGYGMEIKQVPVLLQKEANAMLRIWKRACPLPSGSV